MPGAAAGPDAGPRRCAAALPPLRGGRTGQPDEAFVQKVAEAMLALGIEDFRRGAVRQHEAAARLGLGSGTAVSYLIRRIKERARTDDATARLVERVRQLCD